MSSMFFDQRGEVRACCQNYGFPLGNIREQTIREIWDGTRTRQLRSALREDDFSRGCGFCAWQTQHELPESVFARGYDQFLVIDKNPRWPLQMEFSMSNTCNLQCQMCNGEWSSSIRAHREGRPPLPAVYGESFFSELAEFLPHLKKVNILGGEPFLGKESLRLMEMLASLGNPPTVAVTTNGTQWNRRVEDICEKLPISFVVSLDGVTSETYEAIRSGARFSDVTSNLKLFRSYAKSHGTTVSLAHCLLTSNWREFSDFLRYAEVNSHDVHINRVTAPGHLSLFQLPAEELEEVVNCMVVEQADKVAGLSRLKPVWDAEIAALSSRLDAIRAGNNRVMAPGALHDEGTAPKPWAERAAAMLKEWCNDIDPLRIEFVGGRTKLMLGPNPGADPSRNRESFIQSLRLSDVTDKGALFTALQASMSGTALTTRMYDDLLNDTVISGSDEDEFAEFRVIWGPSDSAGQSGTSAADDFVALLATRMLRSWSPGPEVLFADAHRDLVDLVEPEYIAVLTFDPSGIAIKASGSTGIVGYSHPDDLIGSTMTTALDRFVEHVGGTPIKSDGPSGWVGDSCLHFQQDWNTEGTAFRILVDRNETETTVIIAGGPGSGLR